MNLLDLSEHDFLRAGCLSNCPTNDISTKEAVKRFFVLLWFCWLLLYVSGILLWLFWVPFSVKHLEITNAQLTRDVSNKVAAMSRFDYLRYLTLRYGRYLQSTMSRTIAT